MQFSDLQTEFAEETLDTTTTWAAGGTLNKKCLNKAYDYLYNRLKNAERVKRKLCSNTKTSVTISDYVGTLPSDFSNMDIVSASPTTDWSDVDPMSPDVYWDWNVIGLGTVASPYKIVLNDNFTPIYIRYVPTRSDMSADADIPNLPVELHRSIVDFALIEYYRRIRDPIEKVNAATDAETYLNDRLSTLA